MHLRKEAGWRAEYLHELTIFPGGKYDDQVDSTVQLLDWLKQASREPGGIYQYYKELAGSRTPRGPSRYRRWRKGWASSGGDPELELC